MRLKRLVSTLWLFDNSEKIFAFGTLIQFNRMSTSIQTSYISVARNKLRCACYKR